MPCGWEGNRRSGVALVMRHRLHLVYPPTGSQPRQGDEHPAYAHILLITNISKCDIRSFGELFFSGRDKISLNMPGIKWPGER